MRNARWIIMLFLSFVTAGCSSFASQSLREDEKAILPTTLRIERVEVEGAEPELRILANTEKGVDLCLFAPKDLKVGGLEVDGAPRRVLPRHKHGEYRPSPEDIANWRVLGNFVRLPRAGVDRLPFLGEGTWAQLPGRVPRGINGAVVVPTENGTRALLFLGLVSDPEMWAALKAHYSSLGVNMSKVPDAPPGTAPAEAASDAAPPATPDAVPAAPAEEGEETSYHH